MYDAVGTGGEPARTNPPVLNLYRQFGFVYPKLINSMNDTMRSRSGCVFEPDLRLIVCAIEKTGAGVLGLDGGVIAQADKGGFEVAFARKRLVFRQ